ncbi:unnamed protein product [Brachionus calyciflorus]|uniref:Uncharacterized protein n=1 Tax=Brachionus calyciflorus TaxID=104777 RepID=A0A814I989_9BILA|nr:unnamed protein product [Brachionus calyciflorus]
MWSKNDTTEVDNLKRQVKDIEADRLKLDTELTKLKKDNFDLNQTILASKNDTTEVDNLKRQVEFDLKYNESLTSNLNSEIDFLKFQNLLFQNENSKLIDSKNDLIQENSTIKIQNQQVLTPLVQFTPPSHLSFTNHNQYSF